MTAVVKEKNVELKLRKAVVFSTMVIADRNGGNQSGKRGSIPGGVKCSNELDLEEFFMAV